MQVDEAVRAKRAIRQFASDPMPEDVLLRILHAGRRAQSAKNSQPWRFIVVRDRERLRALSKLGLFDAGQAAAYMQLAAWGLGVGSCLATLYNAEGARTLLRFPADWEAHVALSFGYPAEPTEMTRRPRPGGRRPPDELFHFEEWGRHG
jgi:nitroreductase